jgi:hypothetical protein
MPGFFSGELDQHADDPAGLRLASASRSPDLVDQAEDALLDELDQAFEHLRLAGEVPVQGGLAHFQLGRQGGRGDAFGPRLLQHGGQRLQDLHAPFSRLRALARRGGRGCFTARDGFGRVELGVGHGSATGVSNSFSHTRQ